MTNVYRIDDIVQMASAMRSATFESRDLGVPHPDVGYDGYVTVPQIESMIRDQAEEDEEGYLYIDSDGIIEVEEAIASAVHSAALSKLAAADLIECAWSDEDNDFIYFRKDSDAH